MKKLYIVFDQIPSKESGGLIATYFNLVKLLDQDFEIHIVSIFNTNKKNKNLFDQYPIHVVDKNLIDMRFYKIFSYLLKEKNIKKFIYGIKSLFLYFFSIPIIKKKISKMIYNDDRVVVSSPSAAIFMPRNLNFILEIHTKYEYFFGSNKLGKLQSMLMTRPQLILFRSKVDANKAKNQYLTDYMYNTIDVEKICAIKDYEQVKNKFLFVGRLSSEKNLFKLLSVAAILKEKNQNFTIDIYGTGEMYESLKEEIYRLHLEDYVILKGFINDKHIYFNYAVFLLTSTIEGFPLTIIEAKANATPTITTFWGEAVNETVTDGYDGYIIEDPNEIADKLIILMNNQALLKKISENALNEFDCFSRKESRKKWLEILK